MPSGKITPALRTCSGWPRRRGILLALRSTWPFALGADAVAARCELQRAAGRTRSGHLDVLSESRTTPRLLLGWFPLIQDRVLPLSPSSVPDGRRVLHGDQTYEHRHINNPAVAAVRRSFAFYNEERPLVSACSTRPTAPCSRILRPLPPRADFVRSGGGGCSRSTCKNMLPDGPVRIPKFLLEGLLRACSSRR